MDASEKDAVAITMQSQIDAPLRWDAPPFAIIIDLKESHFDEVAKLIKHHFFKEDPTCKSSFLLGDAESVNGYLDLIRVWMKDSTSIVALSSISGRVIGTVIARINSALDKTNTYSRVQVFHGETLERIMHLKSTLVQQADPYKVFNNDKLFRVYILCVHPSYQEKGLETALLETSIHVGSSFGQSAIVGIFTSGFTQSLAAKIGFRILSKINYNQWIINDKVVFRDPGIGNYSAAFMGLVVPDSEGLQLKRPEKKLLRKKKH